MVTCLSSVLLAASAALASLPNRVDQPLLLELVFLFLELEDELLHALGLSLLVGRRRYSVHQRVRVLLEVVHHESPLLLLLQLLIVQKVEVGVSSHLDRLRHFRQWDHLHPVVRVD